MTRFITEDIEISSGDDNDNPDLSVLDKNGVLIHMNDMLIVLCEQFHFIFHFCQAGGFIQ